MTTQDYKWFSSAEECAEAATPLFESKKWYWKREPNQVRGHIPNRQEILHTLQRLEQLSRDNEGREAESGRLIVMRGRYGYLWPRSPFAAVRREGQEQ